MEQQQEQQQPLFPETTSPMTPLSSSSLSSSRSLGSPMKRKAVKRGSTIGPSSTSLSVASSSSRRKSTLGSNKRGHRSLSDVMMSASVKRRLLSRGGGGGCTRKQQQRQPRLRRSISWDVRPPKVHEINAKANMSSRNEGHNNDDLDDDQCSKNEAWYSKEEYGNIIQEQMNSIAIMRYLRAMGSDDSNLDPDLYCERGLESYQSKEQRHEIDAKRKLHQLMVIQEQTRQAVLGRRDPERLRLMAESQSEDSLRKAQLRAALDQHEVIRSTNINNNNNNNNVSDCPRNFVTTHQDQDTDHATGIVTLASLWAQEDAKEVSSYTVNSKYKENDGLGREKVPSMSSCQGLMNPQSNHIASFLEKKQQQHQQIPMDLDGTGREQKYVPPGLCNKIMPLVVAFDGVAVDKDNEDGPIDQQPPFQNPSSHCDFLVRKQIGSSSFPSQTIQNSFSTFADHTNMSFVPQYQQPVVSQQESTFHPAMLAAHTMLPASAFAALQILDMQQQQPQQHHQLIEYASMFGTNSPRPK
mmetsp:Transcript_19693/g.34613  ORF Transcript_19693/g.34613 Transcript_19693/m.34613 type:complete len:525 (-) Transcript_19693:228-1802(-)